MNVIVANELQGQLADLDIDVIKSISGIYDVNEIVEMFKNFFYSKMVLDVTSLKNYNDFKTYEVIAKGLDPDKIIFLLPEGSTLCTPSFLSRLISFGIYNFTTNINGINYLIKKSNTLKDVEHIIKMVNVKSSVETAAAVTSVPSNTATKLGSKIIGIKDVTEGAGATTFIYMLKKELAIVFGQDKVLAIEIDKNDFILFNDRRMISTTEADIGNVINSNESVSVILVDLNECKNTSFCSDILYLIEPSTIKLNKLVKDNSSIFSKLVDKKVILNRSLLLQNDVFDFEKEAGVKVFYNMPPLDERKRPAIIGDFLTKLGLFDKPVESNGGKIFGLFRR